MTKQLDFKIKDTPPKINEWFVSLEGEGNAIGIPSIYVRLSYCGSSACTFCDTKHSWGIAPNNKSLRDHETTEEMIEVLDRSHVERMTITGGEPLHYIPWFAEMYEWVDSASPKGIKYLGIESNGNILRDKDNCMELVSSFNEIIREYGVFPTLTISPKLDADTCYDKQMTQEEVELMYFKAFDNIADYLQPYDVFYKFIYEYTEEIIDFKQQQVFIDYLIDDLKVPHSNLMLMPFTPDDPLGKDAKIWQESKDATSRKALQLGVKYSPRIHIDRKLD